MFLGDDHPSIGSFSSSIITIICHHDSQMDGNDIVVRPDSRPYPKSHLGHPSKRRPMIDDGFEGRYSVGIWGVIQSNNAFSRASRVHRYLVYVGIILIIL